MPSVGTKHGQYTATSATLKFYSTHIGTGERERGIVINRVKNRERNIDMQSENWTDELKKESEIETDGQIDRQTDEGTGRQIFIVRDSQMKRK